MTKKLKYEYVNKIFENQGCELLEKEYKNNRTKMKYKCNCGNHSYISFSNFKKGKRCKKCGYKKFSRSRKFTYEYIKEYFKKENCKLISEKYIRTDEKLDYICSCGNTSSITFSNFKNGYRCKKCSVERRKRNYILKYGVEHNMQNPESHIKQQKSCFKYKKISKITENGFRNLQGYEPQIYYYLINERSYVDSEIIDDCTLMPVFWYYTENNIKHRYHPDFYIPKDNLIIEVKSEYTYNIDLHINLLKNQTVKKSGYIFEFMIYNPRTKNIDLSYNK